MGKCWCLVVFNLGWMIGCSTMADRLTPEGGKPMAAASYKHGSTEAKHVKRRPHWWKAFNDPTLTELVKHMHAHNPDLAAALARVVQSHAVLGQTRAGLWPTVLGDGAFRSRQDSENSQLFPTTQREYDQYRLGTSVSWEIDLWGRVRNAVKRDQSLLQSEVEILNDASLSLEATLARQYFAWRSARSELAILEEAITVRRDDLKLQEARLELGTGVEVDVSRSRVALKTAEAAAEAVRRSSGEFEHAIAVLLGLTPSELPPLPDSRKAVVLPTIPLGIPASLLVQRPDLRAAEQRLLAAAKDIGVRQTGFLPRISLTGNGGVASLKSSNFFKPGSTLFDIGPEMSVPLFSFRTQRNVVDEGKAIWREAMANYRSDYISAVAEVDDALLDLKSLSKESAIQQQAVNAATETSDIARLRHDRGLTSYFEVVEAERDRLTNKRANNTLRGQQLAATVKLVQALGGTW